MAADGSIHKLTFKNQAEIICGKFKLGDTKLSIKYSVAGVADRAYCVYVSENAYTKLLKDAKELISDKGVVHKGSYAKWGVRIEHMIPTEVVYKYLQKLNEEKRLNEKDLALFVRRKVFCALITKEEDQKLSAQGLRSRMPGGWNIEKDDMLARYHAVGIKMHQF